MAQRSENYIWFDLIQFFEWNHYIHNGLTIPFLVGAIEILQSRKMAISQLVKEFSDLTNKSRTTIMKCGNIGEFVIGIMDIESENYYNNYPQCLPIQFENLVVTDTSLNDYNNFSELVVLFEKEYFEGIKSELYSKNSGIWTKFTQTDIERIDTFDKSFASKVFKSSCN